MKMFFFTSGSLFVISILVLCADFGLIAQEGPRPLPPPPLENVGEKQPFKRTEDGQGFVPNVEPGEPGVFRNGKFVREAELGIPFQIRAPEKTDVYQVVPIAVQPADIDKDVMVMAVIGNEVRFFDVFETKDGVCFFTGPPAKYSIRVTINRGGKFESKTTSTTIGNVTPPVDPNPPIPPQPPPPPTTDNGKMPGAGVYDFAPVSYVAAQKIKNSVGVAAIVKLAENFDTAANRAKLGELNLSQILDLLKDQNAVVYATGKASDWKVFQDAWQANADRLRENEILPGTLEDHQIVFEETAFGLRAAVK